jgi:amino acid transporter
VSGRLKRSLGERGLFCLAFGSIIGIGWVTVLGSWLQTAGPLGAALAFALGGALMLAVALCYAELTSALPVAGGEIAFSYRAFGTAKAFWVGWLLAFGYLSVSAFEAAAVGRVLAYLWPSLPGSVLYTVFGSDVRAGSLLWGLLLTAILTWLNHRGVGVSMAIQTVLTVFLIGVGIVFVGAGLAVGRLENLQPLMASEEMMEAGRGIFLVFVTAPLWFVGFDTIPQVAEEAHAEVAPRRLGRIILTSVAWATVFYVGVILAASAVSPWPALVGEPLPTATAFRRAFAAPFMADLVLWAAVAGLVTSWNGFFVAGTRVLFALGRARMVSPGLGAVHPRHGTPHAAVWLAGAVTAVSCLLGEKALTAFVNVSSVCLAAAFFGVALSAGSLRRSAPDLPRPYRMPAGPLVAFIAAAGSLLICLALIVPSSPAALRWPLEWLLFGGWCLLGVVLWHGARRVREAVPETERARLILSPDQP